MQFIDANLDFIVVGGYAVSAFKHRFSIDADVVIKSEDLEKFEAIVKKENFRKTSEKELENEIRQRKEKELQKLNDNIYKILSNISKEVIGKSLNLSDHEDLIIASLEKAKKERLL